MKLNRERAGYYTTVVGGKFIHIEKARNPRCAPCFRWCASTNELTTQGGIYINGFTLREIRRKLEEIGKDSES